MTFEDKNSGGSGEQISPFENENTTFSSVLPDVGKNVANSDSKSDSNKFPIELSEEQITELEKAAKSGNYPDKQTLNELTTKLELHRSVILRWFSSRLETATKERKFCNAHDRMSVQIAGPQKSPDVKEQPSSLDTSPGYPQQPQMSTQRSSFQGDICQQHDVTATRPSFLNSPEEQPQVNIQQPSFSCPSQKSSQSTSGLLSKTDSSQHSSRSRQPYQHRLPQTQINIKISTHDVDSQKPPQMNAPRQPFSYYPSQQQPLWMNAPPYSFHYNPSQQTPWMNEPPQLFHYPSQQPPWMNAPPQSFHYNPSQQTYWMNVPPQLFHCNYSQQPYIQQPSLQYNLPLKSLQRDMPRSSLQSSPSHTSSQNTSRRSLQNSSSQYSNRSGQSDQSGTTQKSSQSDPAQQSSMDSRKTSQSDPAQQSSMDTQKPSQSNPAQQSSMDTQKPSQSNPAQQPPMKIQRQSSCNTSQQQPQINAVQSFFDGVPLQQTPQFLLESGTPSHCFQNSSPVILPTTSCQWVPSEELRQTTIAEQSPLIDISQQHPGMETVHQATDNNTPQQPTPQTIFQLSRINLPQMPLVVSPHILSHLDPHLTSQINFPSFYTTSNVQPQPYHFSGPLNVNPYSYPVQERALLYSPLGFLSQRMPVPVTQHVPFHQEKFPSSKIHQRSTFQYSPIHSNLPLSYIDQPLYSFYPNQVFQTPHVIEMPQTYLSEQPSVKCLNQIILPSSLSQKSTEVDSLQRNSEASLLQQATEVDSLQRNSEASLLQQATEVDSLQRNSEASLLQQATEVDCLQRNSEASPLQQATEVDSLQRYSEANPLQQATEVDSLQRYSEANPLQQATEVDSLQCNSEASLLQQATEVDSAKNYFQAHSCKTTISPWCNSFPSCVFKMSPEATEFIPPKCCTQTTEWLSKGDQIFADSLSSTTSQVPDHLKLSNTKSEGQELQSPLLRQLSSSLPMAYFLSRFPDQPSTSKEP